jgi:hypothetical protein
MEKVDELKTEGLSTDGAKAAQGGLKVTFTPEQQARIQTLIDEAYRKAFQKAKSAAIDEELKKELEKLREEKKFSSVLRVVARRNVVDPEEAAELIARRLEMDDSGGIANSSETLEEFVERWLSERPHHIRAASAGGGSRSALFGGKPAHNLADPALWRTLPREDMERILKEGITVHGSSGQAFRFRSPVNPFLEARKRKFKQG